MEAFQDTLMKLTGILNDQSEKWFKKVGGENLISPTLFVIYTNL